MGLLLLLKSRAAGRGRSTTKMKQSPPIPTDRLTDHRPTTRDCNLIFVMMILEYFFKFALRALYCNILLIWHQTAVLPTILEPHVLLQIEIKKYNLGSSPRRRGGTLPDVWIHQTEGDYYARNKCIHQGRRFGFPKGIGMKR